MNQHTEGGAPRRPDKSNQTERSRVRAEEDQQFVPVIIKRSDESHRHPDDVLEQAILRGHEQLERPFVSLILSSVAAGMLLAFTAMAVAIVAAIVADVDNRLLQRLAKALVYPLGFIICIMGGTELYTEHTATALYPVLDRREKPVMLARLWIVVIIGNLIGAAIGAGLLTLAEDVIGAREGYQLVAYYLVIPSNVNLLISATLAGWLMAQGAWLILATPPNITQIVCIYMVTFLIGLGGLHHSIAGAVEMFVAVFTGDRYSMADTARFLALALSGNLLGGTMFVALLNYGQIRQSRQVHGNPKENKNV